MRSQSAFVPLRHAHKLHVARTYAYVADGADGLAIIDVTRPEHPFVYQMFNAGGKIDDARDVVVGTTNASLFAYVADGKNGLKVIQLTSPESQPNFYGFSPEPKPQLIAWYPTKQTGAVAVARPGSRPRGGRIRQPDRRLRPHRLASVPSGRDAAPVPGQGRQALVRR